MLNLLRLSFCVIYWPFPGLFPFSASGPNGVEKRQSVNRGPAVPSDQK